VRNLGGTPARSRRQPPPRNRRRSSCTGRTRSARPAWRRTCATASTWSWSRRREWTTRRWHWSSSTRWTTARCGCCVHCGATTARRSSCWSRGGRGWRRGCCAGWRGGHHAPVGDHREALADVVRAPRRAKVCFHPTARGLLRQVRHVQSNLLGPRGLAFSGVVDREVACCGCSVRGATPGDRAPLAYSERTVKTIIGDVIPGSACGIGRTRWPTHSGKVDLTPSAAIGPVPANGSVGTEVVKTPRLIR